TEEEHRKKYQSLEAHRQVLVDDEACPLCGSLHHPFASDHPVFDLKEDILKSKTELLNTKRNLRTATQTNLENEQQRIKTITQDIFTLNKSIDPQRVEVERLCKLLHLQPIPDQEIL